MRVLPGGKLSACFTKQGILSWLNAVFQIRMPECGNISSSSGVFSYDETEMYATGYSGSSRCVTIKLYIVQACFLCTFWRPSKPNRASYHTLEFFFQTLDIFFCQNLKGFWYNSSSVWQISWFFGGFIVKNCTFWLNYHQNFRIFEFAFKICLSLVKNSWFYVVKTLRLDRLEFSENRWKKACYNFSLL